MIKSFDHVAITVKDLDKTIAWYVKHLGFSVKRTFEIKERGIRVAFLGVADQAMLELLGFIDLERAVEGPTLKFEETGIKHVSFFVDDLDGICQHLKSIGVEFTKFFPDRVAFKDLNGIVVELRVSTD